MLLRVGCEFAYESTWPTPAVMLVQPHTEAAHRVVTDCRLAQPCFVTTPSSRCRVRRTRWTPGRSSSRLRSCRTKCLSTPYPAAIVYPMRC